MLRLFLVVAVLIALAKRKKLIEFITLVRAFQRAVGTKRTAQLIRDMLLPSKGWSSEEVIAEYNRRHEAKADQA